MARAAAAIDQAASPMSVDESLWWDSFVVLFDDLENAPLLSDLPASLVNKLKSNHAWFLDSVSRFKAPNATSKLALDAPEISIGSNRLQIRSELREVALLVSSSLGLDEVQSYILVIRSFEIQHSIADYEGPELLHSILVQYYLERQCLLKCIRRLFMHALHMGNESHESDPIRGVALLLVHDGLEKKLFTVLEDLLASAFFEKTEVDLTVLWVEETLIEDSLILDILFLAYYENFCSCNAEQWKNLCQLFKGVLYGLFNIGKLAVSTEARNSFYRVKVQLLLTLIETLDLDNLLLMVHDEIPFRQGYCVFSLTNIQEIDAIVSSFTASETVEVGPLLLAWAVFLCLALSLPDRQDYNTLMEINHVGYVRQAMESAPFKFLIEILDSDSWRNSDGPVAGYLSVLRTFTSAFIASYEITQQRADAPLNLILDILCKIYHGEESLCMQFWDRDSFVDGPVRSLLCLLESEFPFRTVELIRLLSAVCEGAWPAECVFNFLCNMGGITSLFEIPSGSHVVNIYDFVEAPYQLHIAGAEWLTIPSQTRGQVLKVVDGKTALVRWEYAHSGVFLLLLRLAHDCHLNSYEEVYLTLDLVYHMVSCNTALCFALMGIDKSSPMQPARLNGQVEKYVWVDVTKIICTLVCNLIRDGSSAGIVSLGINILAEILTCLPSHVTEAALRANFFGINYNDSSSGMWLLSGGLAKMLLADCEVNAEYCPLTISVLDFTMRLVETGAEDNMVSSLVIFSLQYVLVNHEHWSYKLKYARWKVTLKVFEVIKMCIKAIQSSPKLGCIIRNILLCDSSIHNILFRIMCITTETLERLYVNRLCELREIEGLQLAVCSALEVVYIMLTNLVKCQDTSSGAPVFVQSLLSSTNKPIPVVMGLASLISFSRNSAMQVAASRVLSMLCFIAARVQPYSFENVCLGSDNVQFKDLSTSICDILNKEDIRNEDLLVAVLNLLISAARYQPAFLISIISSMESWESPSGITDDMKHQLVEAPGMGSFSSKIASPINSIIQYVNRSKILIERYPRLLLSIYNLLKAFWEGGFQYVQILEIFRSSEIFWRNLTSFLSTESKSDSQTDNLNGDEILRSSNRYKCQAAVLEIMAHDIFLHKKVLQDETTKQRPTELSKGIEIGLHTEMSKHSKTFYSKDILSRWCESSLVESLIKIYLSSRYEKQIVHRAKMSVIICVVHLIAKLSGTDAGSLSLSLARKIHTVSEKLSKQPAFSTLLEQYSLHGYSEQKEIGGLVLNDLYYHLQGELEGREMAPGPFKDLSQFLLELEIFQDNECKHGTDLWPPDNDVYMFDLVQLRADLGIKFWDHSDWKMSKSVAEKMLSHMHDANLVMFLTLSKNSALAALTTLLSLYEGNINETKPIIHGRGMTELFVQSSIEDLCKHLQATKVSPVLSMISSEDFNFLATEVELLFNLSRSLFRHYISRTATRQFLLVCVLLIRSSGTALRLLSDVRPSDLLHKKAVKLLLALLLTSIESIYRVINKSDSEVDLFAEVSILSLGLLPVLCKYTETFEYCDLSVSTIDLILKGFLTPNTWLPILQNHLQLQLIIHKLQQKDRLSSLPIILNFLLTLARTKGGAEMLKTACFFASLKVVFALFLNDKPFSGSLHGSGACNTSNYDDDPRQVWGLGLAIVSSMICSLGDDFSCTEIVDSAMHYFFSEGSDMMYYFLSSLNIPSDDHKKKRAGTHNTQTSLTALRETEHTLMFTCTLAKHQPSWSKAMKEMDSELRETIIHMLAFISKGNHRIGDSPGRAALLFCPPALKEEVSAHGRPSFVNSRLGWFTLSALGCGLHTKLSATFSNDLSLVTKDRANENADFVHQTYFSDTVAIQVYRIAFLLLKFLCMQAKVAVRRAEEVEFIDLAHFPELPMPEILHGLQDQSISIVIEACEANRSEQIQPETQSVCLLLLQILEKSLYLELCVSQSCGIKPVLGRVDDFSKEIKMLMQVAEKHTLFNAALRSLRQIIALVYPGILQAEAFSEVF